MDDLIKFSRSEEFMNFFNALLNEPEASELVNGIFVDFHPIWANITYIKRMLGLPLGSRIIDPIILLSSPYFLSVPPGTHDIRYIPQEWLDYCSIGKKNQSPFIVKLYVQPTSRSSLSQRSTLENIARNQPIHISILDAPMAEFAASFQGGSECQTTITGTLGGFLEDGNGDHWGLTCGHVCRAKGSVSVVDNSSSRLYHSLNCMHTNFPMLSPCTSSHICNPFTNSGIPDVDIALVKIGTSHTALNTINSLGQITTIYDRLQLSSGSLVSMSGAQSGTQHFQVGAYGVTMKILSTTNGNTYCFKDLFEFFAPMHGPGWMPSRLIQFAASGPQSGDSGSWLCFDLGSKTYAYFGTMIATHGLSGLATFADSNTAWAKSNCNGMTLKQF